MIYLDKYIRFFYHFYQPCKEIRLINPWHSKTELSIFFTKYLQQLIKAHRTI